MTSTTSYPHSPYNHFLYSTPVKQEDSNKEMNNKAEYGQINMPVSKWSDGKVFEMGLRGHKNHSYAIWGRIGMWTESKTSIKAKETLAIKSVTMMG